MQAYVIRQGDHLSRLAATMGFDADEIWNHERNSELREQRGDPDVLAPGDILYVPEPEECRLELTAKTSNRFEAEIPMIRIDTTLGYGGQPLANEPYEVRGVGEPRQLTSDGQGRANFEVPATTRQVTLFLPDQGTQAVARIGHLDPPTSESGIATRLTNLGYLMAPNVIPPELAMSRDPDARAQRLRQAIRLFQLDNDLEGTGELDEQTHDAIMEQHER